MLSSAASLKMETDRGLLAELILRRQSKRVDRQSPTSRGRVGFQVGQFRGVGQVQLLSSAGGWRLGGIERRGRWISLTDGRPCPKGIATALWDYSRILLPKPATHSGLIKTSMALSDQDARFPTAAAGPLWSSPDSR